MKVISGSVENFASYKKLDITFTGQGLTLISGPTGSGKSTLCDIIPWVLFGKTAKGGTVDEILSWNSSEPTQVKIELLTNSGRKMTVSRIRGGQSNDLYYATDSASFCRGKDVTDTQRQINSLLGISIDTYLMGAYYHEFSQAATFFTAPAKQRRQTLDQVVDLKLVKTITTALSEELNVSKALLSEIQPFLIADSKHLEYLKKQLCASVESQRIWDLNQAKLIQEIEGKANSFDLEKEKTLKSLLKKQKIANIDRQTKIDDLKASIVSLEADIKPSDAFDVEIAKLKKIIEEHTAETCVACGAQKGSDKRVLRVQDMYRLEQRKAENQRKTIELRNLIRDLSLFSKIEDNWEEQINRHLLTVNTYEDQLKQHKETKNPHVAQRDDLRRLIDDVKSSLARSNEDINALKTTIADINVLSSIADDFKALTIKNTIRSIQDNTNRLLVEHFDAEIKVAFSAQDSDKVEVSLQKDGNECSFTQLSKGQRQLLKICFAISLMRQVSNHSGVSFNALYLDEAFDGLDEDLKVKAYGLLQQLETEYESVFCVEHSSSLKSLFTKEYCVELVNGNSVINEKT